MDHFNPNTRQLDERELRLRDQLIDCRKVEMMVQSKGWEEVIGPLLKRRIGGLLGEQHPNGVWKKGKVQGARKEEVREYYIGYLNSLMDTYNDIVNYVNNIQVKEKAINDIEKTRQAGTRIPLADGGSYAP